MCVQPQRWKFPGGLSDLGEGICSTAVREVLEETGIETGTCVPHACEGVLQEALVQPVQGLCSLAVHVCVHVCRVPVRPGLPADTQHARLWQFRLVLCLPNEATDL